MTILNDAGPKLESAATMSNASPANAAVGPAPATQGDDTASTITVNTKAPNFPPPKTDKPRPHICTTCTRSFARLEHLKRHERSHTKEKPFECPECTRCFARRDLLLRHQQKLHQTTTPSSRPRNRRESASGAAPGQSRARKNSVAGTNAAAAAAASANMRPRANTISHVDGAAMQMMAAANAAVACAPQQHSRHASLVGIPLHNMNHVYHGMSSAMGHRGLAHGLPKLETHGFPMDYSSGLRTAPPMAHFHQPEFEFDSMFFGGPGTTTINPNALHYNDSPHSMGIDSTSPYSLGFPDMSAGHHHLDDGNFDFLNGFEQSMMLNGNENAVDGSSPSAISTTSQSGMSDVMVDGSNNPASTTAGTSSMWQPSLMGPPQMPNHYSLDMHAPLIGDLFNGTPLSPQPHQQKNAPEAYFSTPPPSMSSMSPSIMTSLNAQNMNQALNFGAGPETPTSMNGSNHGTSPVSTITDSTRNAILGALSSAASQISAFAGRKPSFTMQSSPLSPHAPVSDHVNSLPSTKDLQRFVAAYLRFFHPHLPFLHIPTLSFEVPIQSANNTTKTVGGPAVLILSMAAIGALYEMDHDRSRGLFEMAKKMIQTYLEQRRRVNVKKAGFRGASEQGTEPDNSVDTPVWLVQSMLLNVVYGHNCGDKRAAEIASTHCAALSSLAQGAGLLRPSKFAGIEDQDMDTGSADGTWTGGMRSESQEQAEWLRWKTMEERKRTLYAVLILSSLLVSAYNHAPTLTNSEILLDLPCDEEFFSAETSAVFHAVGGVAAANHNRVTFHDALGELLRTNEKQQNLASSNGHHPFDSSVNLDDLPPSNLKPSTFGCLILINALHNYIWETRQRHHNKVWTNEETEKMHRHIEPALKAWQAAWASNPHHSLERPNPFGKGPLSADAIPLLDLAYVRLFVNLSRSKDKFWQRDWDGMAVELSRGSEIIQHAEQSPAATSESAVTDQSETSGSSSVFLDTPITQTSSSDFARPRLSIPAQQQQQQQTQAASRATSRRERHLRKAAFYAADSLSMADKLGITFADFTSRELPIQSAMCAFDCAQVLAEWVATLQDRVGRYLGILGQDEVDLSQVPAIMLLEEEDVKLLAKIQEVLACAELKMNMEAVAGVAEMDPRVQTGGLTGYAAKILRVIAYMLNKAAVWPVTHLMAQSLDTHANHMKARAEKSVMAQEQNIMM